MTLATNIRVLEPTDPKELHDWCNKNLLRAENPQIDTNDTRFMNEPGQGFDAWLITRHNNGAELEHALAPTDYDREDYDTDEEYEADLALAKTSPTGYVDLDFDTTYGFRNAVGGCTALHATYIIRLMNEYLTPRGLTFAWKNEYKGTWHIGIEGMEDFLNNGDNAMDWFNNVALPAIARDIAAGQL